MSGYNRTAASSNESPFADYLMLIAVVGAIGGITACLLCMCCRSLRSITGSNSANRYGAFQHEADGSLGDNGASRGHQVRVG